MNGKQIIVVKALPKNTISKADTFYDSSFEGIKDIPLSCRFSIIVARRLYRHIGKKILEKKDITNYEKAGKIYVSNFSKIIQTILSLVDLIRLFFIRPKEYEKKIEYNFQYHIHQDKLDQMKKMGLTIFLSLKKNFYMV